MDLSLPGQPAPDLYQLLAVSHDASGEDITRAYRRQARVLHPDSRPHDAAAPARFRALAEAYHVLSDPARRAEYDQERRPQPGRGPRPAADSARPSPAGPLTFLAPGMPTPAPPRGAALWAGPVHVEPPPGRPGGGQPRDDGGWETAVADRLRRYLADPWGGTW